MSKQSLTEIVAGLAVQIDSVTVTVYEPDEFKRSIESADCPARILLPSTEGDVHTLTKWSGGFARTMRMTWVIKDLLLYKPVEEGMGWYEVAYDLDDYVDSYASALVGAQRGASGFCGTGPSTLESADWTVGTFTYPVGGTRSYYGVMTTLRIVEVLDA